MIQYKYLYLHGFASSAFSKKAQYLQQCFLAQQLNLNLIDLNNQDFSHLTLTRQINQVASYFKQDNQIKFRIIGSSFGGLTTVWLAEKYPQKIDSIILLAPAFNFKNQWLPKLSAETLKQWQDTGYLSVYHYGEKRELPLNYQFLVDLNQYNEQKLNQRISTLILHGINDETITINASREYSKNRPWVNLIELESDHSLTDVLPIIWTKIKNFWQLF